MAFSHLFIHIYFALGSTQDPSASSVTHPPPPPLPAPSTSAVTAPVQPPSEGPNDPRSKNKIHSKKNQLSENDFAVLKGIVQCMSYPALPSDSPAEQPSEFSPVSAPTAPPRLSSPTPSEPSENPRLFPVHCPPHTQGSNKPKNIYRGGSPISSDEDGNQIRSLECDTARCIDEMNRPNRHANRGETERQPQTYPSAQTHESADRRHDRPEHSFKQGRSSKGQEREPRGYRRYDREGNEYHRARRDREEHDYRRERPSRESHHYQPRAMHADSDITGESAGREERSVSLSPLHQNRALSSPLLIPPRNMSPPLIPHSTVPLIPPPHHFMAAPSLLPHPNFIPPSTSPYPQQHSPYTPPYPPGPYPNGLQPQLGQVPGPYSPPILFQNFMNQGPPLNQPPSAPWSMQGPPYPIPSHAPRPPGTERSGRGRHGYKSNPVKREFVLSHLRQADSTREQVSNPTPLAKAAPPEPNIQQREEQSAGRGEREKQGSPLSNEADPSPPVCSPIIDSFIEPLSDLDELESVSDLKNKNTDTPRFPVVGEGLSVEMKSPVSETDVEEPCLKIVLPEDANEQPTGAQPGVMAVSTPSPVQVTQQPLIETNSPVLEPLLSPARLAGVPSCDTPLAPEPTVSEKARGKPPLNTVHRHAEPRILIAPIDNSVLHTSFRSGAKSPLFSPPHRAIPLQLPVRYSAAISSDESLKFSVPFPLPKTPEESPQSDRSNPKSPSVTPSPSNLSSSLGDSLSAEEIAPLPRNTKSKRGKRKSETPARTRPKRAANQVRLWGEDCPGLLQDDACLFYCQAIPKCLECKKHQHHSSMSYLTQLVNERRAACGFIGFRMLSDLNKTSCVVTGFLTDKEADSYDLSLWRFSLPSDLSRCIPAKEAVYLLTSLQHHFCTSMLPDVELHHAASQSVALSQVPNQGYPAWKKHVYQARELCDVCETAIFSSHFFCDACSYTVCRKCFELKSELPETEQDLCKEFMWRYCAKKHRKHKPSDLLIAEIVPHDIVTETHQEMHSVLRKLDIDRSCVVYEKLPLAPPNTKASPEAIPLTVPTPFPVLAPYTYLCDGQILNLLDAKHEANIRQFRQYWNRGEPLVISNCHRDLDPDLWQPESFARDFGDEVVKPVDCLTRNAVSTMKLRTFWNGFTDISERIQSTEQTPLILKLKDWPPDHDFMDKMPERYEDYTANLPMPEYTTREGTFNLASRLPPEFLKPDLGPKMYIAYGSAAFDSMATTSLHIDISDAMNLMIFVSRSLTTVPDADLEKIIQDEVTQIGRLIAESSIEVQERAKNPKNIPGALWHIFSADDSPKIRQFIRKYHEETNTQVKETSDPIHDQSIYLDQELRHRLSDEYGVVGWEIIQFVGDSIFIPAGAPHQVKNLFNCIKVAEDFVSPENVSHCIRLTEEFRHLSKFHTNHEDKLQINNIVYHSVKDAIGTLKKVLEKYS